MTIHHPIVVNLNKIHPKNSRRSPKKAPLVQKIHQKMTSDHAKMKKRMQFSKIFTFKSPKVNNK
jgi:hypothetical protein